MQSDGNLVLYAPGNEPIWESGTGPAVPTPSLEPSFTNCSYLNNPTTLDYLHGAQCPPDGFPYQPIIKDTDAGQRAMDPFTEGCSGFMVTEDQVHFDFRDSCATHDYGYDLIRYGGTGITEPDVDDRFFKDMNAHCGTQSYRKPVCHAMALGYRGVVGQAGNPHQGDDITSWS